VVDDADVQEADERVEEVYRSEALKLWRAVLGYAGDRQVADDAVAEAFARALRSSESIHDLRAWIWRVTFRLAAAEIRRRERPADRPTNEVAEILGCSTATVHVHLSRGRKRLRELLEISHA
jgi:DNA-directed RNA polymerase specialized sigma24 family protein